MEVFNILYVESRKVHCENCARSSSKILEGFIVLEEVRNYSLTVVRILIIPRAGP